MSIYALSSPATVVLPLTGFSRWEQLRHFVPVSRETWRKLVRDGRAPQPKRLTERCTVYNNEEVHRWIRDPASYRVPQLEAAGAD